MKLPNWLKIIWWVLLVGVFAYLIYQRYDFIMSGATTATDIVIFLILTALLVIPLFQEVSIFGVSLKQKIDTLEKEFDKQIISLKSEIRNIQNVYVYPSTPSSDSELRDLEKTIKPIFEETLKEHGIDKPISIPEELDVPTDTVFLFKVRYALDKELGRITNRWWTPPEERRYQSSLRAAIKLADRGVIVPASLELIREVFAICSSAIHGEDVTEASVKFVKDASSTLLPYLKSIEVQPPAWLPRDISQWMQKQPPPWEPKKERKT